MIQLWTTPGNGIGWGIIPPCVKTCRLTPWNGVSTMRVKLRNAVIFVPTLAKWLILSIKNRSWPWIHARPNIYVPTVCKYPTLKSLGVLTVPLAVGCRNPWGEKKVERGLVCVEGRTHAVLRNADVCLGLIRGSCTHMVMNRVHNNIQCWYI